ncbi:MAG: hypothetical protein QM601_04995 [Pseudoxanthomonas sp.]
MLKAMICVIPLVFLLGACLYSLDCVERHWRIDQWPGPLRRLLAVLDRPVAWIGLLAWVTGATLASWDLMHLLFGPHWLAFGHVANGWQPQPPPPTSAGGPLFWGGCLMLAGTAWLAVVGLFGHLRDLHRQRPRRRA